MTTTRQCILPVLLLLAGGCTAPREPLTVGNPDPSIKIPAIEQATGQKNRTALPELVRDLESDDPAVRFYAIQSLQRLTGTTLGYAYYQDEDERQPAVARWQHWLSAQGGK